MYERGIIDATWKCWHCFAVDQGKHYGDIIGTVRELFFHHPYAERRLDMKRAKAMRKLVKNQENRQDSDEKFIFAAANRIAAALQVAATADSSQSVVQQPAVHF